MNFSQRSYELELLDRDDIPFADIRLNMQELEMVNTRLGGHAITIKGLKKIIGNRKQIHVCEIGCGGGDNLVALSKWCTENSIDATFSGIDIKPACIAFAKENKVLTANTNWIVSDYRTSRFQHPPDIIFSSLFCHHFTDAQLINQLQWMWQNATIGFFINDLHRHPLAFYSIKFITRIVSKSYLVKNDAPLSVQRGFKKKDWEKLMQQAGINNFKISWEWAFRWLIISRNADSER